MPKARPSPFLEALQAGIRRLVPDGQRILLAVSGGPDSLALALGWSALRDRFDHELHLAHFDHRLRPGSGDDRRFVEELGRRLALPVTVGQAAAPIEEDSFGSLEEAARKARYAFLIETAARIEAPFVATGHTADDQVETVLFSIFRGTGLHGLAGIPARRPLGNGMTLVRPMLFLRRSDVEAYLRQLGETPRIDPTNAEAVYTRNWLRLELLPLLRERLQPRVDEAVLRLADIAGEVSAFLTSQADRVLRDALLDAAPGCCELSIDRLVDKEPVLLAEVFRLLLDRQNWPRARVGARELRRLAELLDDAAPRACDLPDGLRAERTKRAGRLVLRLCLKADAEPDAT